MTPAITKFGLLGMQVCVPKEWTDKQVKAFADNENHAGTTHGWQVTKEGDKLLIGHPERVECSACVDNVHIMLVC